MPRRQTVPRQWLIVADEAAVQKASLLPRGCGVLLLIRLNPGATRRLRQIAASRKLTIAEERAGDARRVHDVRELRSAMLRRTPLILLSPIHPTASHPDWTPIPRMRAAALVRLAGQRVIALGGMDARRFTRVEDLGFQAWAGISAFRT